MKMKTWMMVLAAAAVMAAVSGCLDPVSVPYRPAADGPSTDSPVAGVPATGDFTVSLVAGGPSVEGLSVPSSQGRAVVGPDAGAFTTAPSAIPSRLSW
jgi:hypothetical protein